MDPDDLELDEIADQAEVVGKLTPREYAKLRHYTPQNIYHHIRNGHIKIQLCVCGRKVIDVKEADEFFGRL